MMTSREVRRFRELSELTVKACAKKCGWTDRTQHEIEKHKPPAAYQVAALCRVFGIGYDLYLKPMVASSHKSYFYFLKYGTSFKEIVYRAGMSEKSCRAILKGKIKASRKAEAALWRAVEEIEEEMND